MYIYVHVYIHIFYFLISLAYTEYNTKAILTTLYYAYITTKAVAVIRLKIYNILLFRYIYLSGIKWPPIFSVSDHNTGGIDNLLSSPPGRPPHPGPAYKRKPNLTSSSKEMALIYVRRDRWADTMYGEVPIQRMIHRMDYFVLRALKKSPMGYLLPGGNVVGREGSSVYSWLTREDGLVAKPKTPSGSWIPYIWHIWYIYKLTLMDI